MALSLGFGYGQKKQRAAQSSETKQFSDEILAKLEDTFSSLLGQSGREDELVKSAINKALASDIDIEPIMAEARRQMTNQTGQLYQRLARQAGSDANSLVNAAQAEAIAAGESNLASTEAQLLAENNKNYLDNLTTALQAESQSYQPLLGIGQLLKGGKTTSKGLTKGSSSSWQVAGEGSYQGN